MPWALCTCMDPILNQGWTMSSTAYIVHSPTTALAGLQRGGYHVISLFSEWPSRGFRGGGGGRISIVSGTIGNSYNIN